MDSTYSIIEKAVKGQGIKVEKADRNMVASALKSEGINPDDYNFSLDKKDIMIDAYENGDTIYMYKGFGKSSALLHEYIHKWWKKNGNERYCAIVKKKFPNKWEEVCNSKEYSQILDNEMEIAGEVLAKSLENDLASFIDSNKNNLECLKGADINGMAKFGKEDFCRCIACSLFTKNGFSIKFRTFDAWLGDIGILMF